MAGLSSFIENSNMLSVSNIGEVVENIFVRTSGLIALSMSHDTRERPLRD